MRKLVLLFALSWFCMPSSGQQILVPSQYDWGTCQGLGSKIIDGLVFRNSRWDGKQTGCIYVKHGPEKSTWWIKQDPNKGFSAPSVGWGSVFGVTAPSSVGHVPCRLDEIEEYKVWMDISLGPKKPGAQFKIYNQMWFSTTGDSRNIDAGDFAPTFYQENCSDVWWGKQVDEVELNGTGWRICDIGYNQVGGNGRYFSDQMHPYPQPDENRRIVFGPIDFKALIDYHVKKGNYPANVYLMGAQLAWEFLDAGVPPPLQMCNDYKIVFKRKGKARVTIPSFSTMGDAKQGKVKLSSLGEGGGTVEVSPAGTYFDTGSVVTLTAKPDPRKIFTEWTGDVTGTNPSVQLTLNQDKTAKAHFDFNPDLPVILNGDFANGSTGWQLYKFNENNGALETGQQKAAISMNSGSSEWWHVQLLQTGLPLSQGDELVLTFDAKAVTGSRTMNVVVKYINPDNQYLDTTLTLSTSMQSYSLPFVVSSQPVHDPRLEFNLGKDVGNVEIDNVVISSGTLTNSKNTVVAFKPSGPNRLIADAQSISWQGLASAPWTLEVFDILGNRLASSTGTGHTAKCDMKQNLSSEQMLIVRVVQLGKSVTKSLKLQR